MYNITTKPLRTAAGALFVICYSFIVLGLVATLAFFHSFLVVKNVTTYEHIYKRFKNVRNPYSHNFFKNIYEVRGLLFNACIDRVLSNNLFTVYLYALYLKTNLS